MSSSFWDFLGGVGTGGLGFLAGDASSNTDLWDPFHLFSKSRSEKFAEEQWEWQKDWYDKNYRQQLIWNAKNFGLQQSAFQYQKDLNAMQMEREDIAVQRRVADLEAAGLSPTLAAGSAASATPVHAGNAPQGVAPQHEVGFDPRVQVAMFKEGLMKDRMALALTAMGNIADVSRTKAETEFIKAQKDKLVQETPVDMRIKEELALLNEQLHSIRVDQAKQDLTNSEADYISKLWDHVAASDDHILKTTKAVREELGVKLDEQALRIGASEENIKKTEALIKGIALKLEEYQLKTETKLQEFYDNLGVPRGVHDKPAYAPFTLIRGLVEGADKGGTWLLNKAKSGLSKLPFFKK